MKKVLIVDHHFAVRKRLKSIILRNKYEVVAEASNGADAVSQYKIHQPDLVIMDIIMPVMDGLTATEVILDNDPSAHIIVCSSIGHKRAIKQMIDAGVSDFIIKPFLEEQVVMALEKQFQ